jgi:uncharacterized membrane protein YdcZ (DUF606 family)|eukprot:COSAG02_NODE_18117_length_960_cov_0.976771_1_plen_69_part_00
MNQILEAVQTTFELQQEVNNALGELSVRHEPAAASVRSFIPGYTLSLLLLLLHRDTSGSATQLATTML